MSQEKALSAASPPKADKISDRPTDCLYEYREENAPEQGENERRCLLLTLEYIIIMNNAD